MTGRLRLAAIVLAAAAALPLAALDAVRAQTAPGSLIADLDAIFDDPVLARALVGARVDVLTPTPTTLYARNAGKLVMPASNLKLLTIAAAADRLGWDFTYETRVETAAPVTSGVLRGDLVVVGSGDPSIASLDFEASPVFREWADALWQAGVRRIDGRLIGDDDAFDDAGIGPGWAWDYLADGYAASSGALNYNENVAVLRITPAAAAGDAAAIALSPPGHGLDVVNEMTTGEAGTPASVELRRLPGSARLVVRGRVPAGAATTIRTAAVDNPTQFFVDGLRLAIVARGIAVTGGAWDIDAVVPRPGPAGTGTVSRRVIARRTSPPLSTIAAYSLKVSQNGYAEAIMKSLGRTASAAAGSSDPGSVASGRQVVRDTLTSWGVPPDAYVIYDGSGLSRYNYASADAIVGVLTHVWRDARLRGPFVAALPVGGHDGTLESRMKGTILDANVEAKTGTIANVRSLSGYLESATGTKIVFAIIANNFTAPSAQVDAVMERALARLAR